MSVYKTPNWISGSFHLQGVHFISHFLYRFGESASKDQEEAVLSACTLWWESMLDHAMSLHPAETCAAVKLLNGILMEGKQPLGSRILSGLTEEVIVHVDMHNSVCIC